MQIIDGTSTNTLYYYPTTATKIIAREQAHNTKTAGPMLIMINCWAQPMHRRSVVMRTDRVGAAEANAHHLLLPKPLSTTPRLSALYLSSMSDIVQTCSTTPAVCHTAHRVVRSEQARLKNVQWRPEGGRGDTNYNYIRLLGAIYCALVKEA